MLAAVRNYNTMTTVIKILMVYSLVRIASIICTKRIMPSFIPMAVCKSSHKYTEPAVTHNQV